jgi:hypothetical protein
MIDSNSLESENEIANTLIDDFGSHSDFSSTPQTPKSSHSSPQKTEDQLRAAQHCLNSMSPVKFQTVSAQSDFGPINIKDVKELPGPKWSNNSCWLDAFMEALWCPIAFHGAFTELEDILKSEAAAERPSPMYFFYLVCKHRMNCGLREFKGSQANDTQHLTQIRDNFQQTLHNIQAINGKVGEYQGILVS